MRKIFNNKEKGLILEKTYLDWKLNALEEAGYFIIFQGLLETDILQKISGNAFKLYVYLGINANNMTGIVWHSNSKISLYFNKSERTIRSWMKELEDLNLIERVIINKNGYGRIYTYLKAYPFKKNKLQNTPQTNEEQVYDKLIIDSVGCLYIKCANNNYLPFTNDMEVVLKKDGEWIEGKIEAKRKEYNSEEIESIEDLTLKINYVFKSKVSNYQIEIEKNNNLNFKVFFDE